jgi:transmembrane sensor
VGAFYGHAKKLLKKVPDPWGNFSSSLHHIYIAMDMPDYENYENYSSRDFICDPFFQEAVIDPAGEKAAFWKHFLLQYPAQTENIQVAHTFLKSIAFREELPAGETVAASFNRHLAGIHAQEENSHTAQRRTAVIRKITRLAVAVALAAALLTIALTKYFQVGNSNGRKLHQTQYGKTEQIVLPDGSTVMLNAHSSLEYASDWDKQAAREVWLKGEGYFEVKHVQEGPAQPAQRFRVHTHDLTVEVLGTSFDIRERRGITEVVLETGKIVLLFRDPKKGTIIMQPGDRVLYDPRQEQLIKDTTSAADYTAWKKNKLILKNPTVREITKYLEDNFGYRIQLEDPRMGNKIINGPILYDNLDDALFILSTVLNTEVLKQDSTIILRPR